MLKRIIPFALLLSPLLLFATTEVMQDSDVMHRMTVFILQVAVIIFAARLGNILFTKMKLPPVLGELFAGILLGPYLLGGIPIPGFREGLFHAPGTQFFVLSHELFALATLASVLHLFLVGLETDVNMFVHFSLSGLFVGIFGLVVSFFSGSVVASCFINDSLFCPKSMFLGVMCAITAVGITTRILSDRRKLDSPEGITIMEGAVFDDAVGMILLAVTLGYSFSVTEAGAIRVEWKALFWVGLKAFLLCAGVAILGIAFSARISQFLKLFKNTSFFSIIAFAIALLIAGLFEQFGMAMIIGAYIIGLSLSRTELHYVIKDNLKTMHNFFIPVFFTIMGMLIDIRIFTNKFILLFGLTYTAVAIAAKFFGCGIPALFTGFNVRGACRIGVGMIPRGEIVLVVAAMWLSHGVIDNNIFSVAMIMTIITTLLASPVFSHLIRSEKAGMRKKVRIHEKVSIEYNYPTEDITTLFVHQVIELFKEDGFFINVMEIDGMNYRISKENILISIYQKSTKIIFNVNESDVHLVRVVIYETYIHMMNIFNKMDTVDKPVSLAQMDNNGRHRIFNQARELLVLENIFLDLKGRTKNEIISELIDLLYHNRRLKSKDRVLADVLERENSMSTGFQDGIAIPHAKTSGVSSLQLAIGLKKEGIDFNAYDGKLSQIFIMILSPRNNDSSYLQVLSSIAKVISGEHIKKQILKSKTAFQIYSLLREADW